MNTKLMTDKLMSWKKSKEKLDYFKKLEVGLRKELLEEIFPAAGEGTLNTSVSNISVKGTFRTTVNIDRPMLEDDMIYFSAKEADCISWTPNLLKAKYKELEPCERKNLDKVLTFKPALPSLSIEIEED